MDTPTNITHIRSEVRTLGLPVKGYRPGQQLMATVINGSRDSGSPGNIVVRIGNDTLQVRSTMELSKGDVLKLQVMRLQPQTMLATVAINGVKPSIKADPLKSALLLMQPRQGGLPELFGTINALIGDRSTGNLSAHLAAYLRQFVTSFLTKHEVNQSAALSQAFLNSGLFLESKMMNRKTDPQLDRDIKATLLGLLGVLGKTGRRASAASRLPRRVPGDSAHPPQCGSQPIPQPRSLPGDLGSYNEIQIHTLLKDLIDAAVSRLTLHQITAVQNGREGDLRWLTEIPITNNEDADVLHLCVSREHPGAGGEAEARWSAELALDIPALGPVCARLSLYKGRISGTLWAERRSTFEKLNTDLRRLEDAFAARDLRTGNLACYLGKPVANTPDRESLPLLDIQA